MPEEPKEPKILHVIDGIAEYDNDPPKWILNIFYGSIVFSVIYWVLFPSWFGPGVLKWSQIGKYDKEVIAAQAAAEHESLATEAAEHKNGDSQEATLDAGRAVYTQNCVACHGAAGQGGIGPNLQTPPYWAYGKGEQADIAYIVINGTADKAKMNPESKGGMPPWGTTLGKTKVSQVVSYVYSLEHPAK